MKAQTLYSDLNDTEKVAAEKALHDLRFQTNDIQQAVHDAVNYYNEGNIQPEYEDEPFFGEEADYDKVYSYVSRVYVSSASRLRGSTITASYQTGKLHKMFLRSPKTEFGGDVIYQLGFHRLYPDSPMYAAYEGETLYVVDLDAGKGWRYPNAVSPSADYLQFIIEENGSWEEFHEWLIANYAEYEIDSIPVNVSIY